MKKFFIGVIVSALVLPVFAAPYIGYLYPAGIKAGTTVRVLIGGQNLYGIRGGIVSGTGVRIKRAVAVPGFPLPISLISRFLI